MPEYVVIIFLSFAGFLIAFYIAHKKRRHEKMTCPLNFHCDPVINSRYARFLGVPLETLGMFYYGTIAAGYGVRIIAPDFLASGLGYLLVALSSVGLLFSFYLVFIQMFALRAFCSWCLASGAISALIFIFAVTGAVPEILPFLAAHRDAILILHLFAMAIGLGAATVTDILFFRFLRDFRISQLESEILETISQIIWSALALIVLSGIGLFLPAADALLASPLFRMKMLIVLVIILNGAVLNLLVAPKLVAISFGEEHGHAKGELHRIRRLAFALGPISVVSWYSAFLVAALDDWPHGFLPLLLFYLAFLAVGIGSGQFIERHLAARASQA